VGTPQIPFEADTHGRIATVAFVEPSIASGEGVRDRRHPTQTPFVRSDSKVPQRRDLIGGGDICPTARWTFAQGKGVSRQMAFQ
jgi:hypothetical protein